LQWGVTAPRSPLLDRRVFFGGVALADQLGMFELGALRAVQRLFRRMRLLVDLAAADELPLCLVILPRCGSVSFTLVILIRPTLGYIVVRSSFIVVLLRLS
jgi:hypothetical protein